ncbi:hypothetical protein ACL598_17495 [Bordetella bronchialis]|uniref:hypothetical protein n=1 Tax=Bordetella bronchialis TaxID=463025 RepID=UPI003CFC6C84
MTQASIAVSQTPPLPGLSLVQTTNAAFQTVATDFSGDADPASLAGPFMKWADTANGLLKRRNAANTAWVTVGSLWQRSVDVYPLDSIPSDDQGPINVPGIGPMEWAGTAYAPLIRFSECRLDGGAAGGSIKLSRCGGSRLTIGNETLIIPIGGIEVVPSGLTAGTIYNAYAYSNDGAIALEYNTTPHVTHTDGTEIKSGDPSRLFVGMFTTDGTGVVSDTAASRCVASWFNKIKKAATVVAAGVNVTSTGSTVITSPNLIFLIWGGYSARVWMFGTARNNSASGSTSVNFNGTTGSAFQSTVTSAVANAVGNFSQDKPVSVSADSRQAINVQANIAPSGTVGVVSCQLCCEIEI